MASLLFVDTMIATERMYDSSVRVISDCLTSRKQEVAVYDDADTIADNSAMLRLLLGEVDNPIPIYAYDSDEDDEEEEVSTQDLVTLIQERLKKEKANEVSSSNDLNAATENDRGQQNVELSSKLKLLCSHEQYGLDICMFLLSPNSPLHCPDHFRYDQGSEEDEVVPENDTSDNDEAWFGIDCSKELCGQYAIQADEKTLETVADTDSSNDGSTTVDDSYGDSTIELSEEEESLLSDESSNALTAHLKNLIAKNKRANGDVQGVGLDCNGQSILTGEIAFPKEEQPEPVGRSMTQPSEDDYLMLIQGDPKGRSFCTDDSSEADDLRPPPVQAGFITRKIFESMHLEPDGGTLAPVDEVSLQSKYKSIHDDTKTCSKILYLEIPKNTDLVQENSSVTSSKWSHRALLDDDHESILDEDSLEHIREQNGSKLADIALSSAIFAADKPSKNLPSADNIIEAISKDGHTGVSSEPFDEADGNRASPHQQIRNELVAVDSREPKTNLQKRLNLLEKLRGLSDDDSDRLCACVQGCGDFADATFFECSPDEASIEDSETVEQLSLD